MHIGKLEGSVDGRVVNIGGDMFALVPIKWYDERQVSGKLLFISDMVCLGYKEDGEEWVLSENPQIGWFTVLNKQTYHKPTTRTMTVGLFLNLLDGGKKEKRLPFKRFIQSATGVYIRALRKEESRVIKDSRCLLGN